MVDAPLVPDLDTQTSSYPSNPNDCKTFIFIYFYCHYLFVILPRDNQ